MNILVLCTGNSARSILLEALLNDLGGDMLCAYSAGSQPAGKVHSQSLVLLAAKGHDVKGYRSKSWDEFAAADAPVMDLVITVCGSAAAENCPIWPGAPVRAHWGVEDPAAANDVEAPAAFATAYGILKRRAEAFIAASPQNLDSVALKTLLAQCGDIA